jgi:hypothetical protein
VFDVQVEKIQYSRRCNSTAGELAEAVGLRRDCSAEYSYTFGNPSRYTITVLEEPWRNGEIE